MTKRNATMWIVLVLILFVLFLLPRLNITHSHTEVKTAPLETEGAVNAMNNNEKENKKDYGFLKFLTSLMLPRNYLVSERSPHIVPSYVSPANQFQSQAWIWMGVYREKLHFVKWNMDGLVNRNPYSTWLCVFENGSVTKLKELPHRQFSCAVGYTNDLLYYYDFDYEKGSPDERCTLYVYSFAKDNTERVISSENIGFGSPVFADDVLYLPQFKFYGEPQSYLQIRESSVMNFVPPEKVPSYRVGAKEYYLARKDGEIADLVYCRDENGKIESLDLEKAQERVLIPTEKGLLVHNQGWQHLLYYIDERGDLAELFSVDCFTSSSTVTVCKNTVYVSVMRFENGGHFGAGGMQGISGDTLSGTYQISLTDYSVKKISDEYYNGLYIFDDTGIYACDKDCSIYLLDFDGNVIETLLEVKGR